MPSDKSKFQNKVISVIGLYIAACLIRFMLALATSAYPIVNIDEFLYYGMARSIAAGGGLLFRGQAANYSYIFYSLVLSPVFMLGIKGPALYRILQLWNIMIASLSVFPIFYLAKDWIVEKGKAFRITLLCMLLPDFMLGQLMMCENVILPLFYTAFLVINLYLKKPDIRKVVLIGLLGGLMFSAKPGALIPAAVFLVILLAKGIKERNKAECFHSLLGIVSALSAAVLFFIFVRLLGGKPSVLSIYDVQVSNSGHLNVFVRFLGVYVLYFLLASGTACVALAISRVKHASEEQRLVFLTIAVSMAVTITGVCWSVNRYEYNANTAHMRYIGMYIPLLFVFSMIPPYAPAEKKSSASKKSVSPCLAAFFVAALLIVILGIYAGVNRYTVFAENMSLAGVISLFRNNVSPVLLAVLLIVGLSGLSFVFWRRNQKAITRITAALFLVSMILNNAAAYSISKNDTRFDFAESTEQLMDDLSGSEEILYLYTAETTTHYYGALDIYSSQDICYTTLDDMFNHLYASRGVYVPFLPEARRGSITVNSTPDTDTIVMDATVYYMLGLSDNTLHYSHNDNALHAVKILDKSKPWLDWIVGNTKNTILSAGNKGIILVFNDRLLDAPLTFTMTIYSEHGTTLKVYSNQETRSITLESGQHEYEITFDKPQDAYNLEAQEGDIRFYGFSMHRAEDNG